ncbi:MAG: ABC transporter permease [Pseudomonadota bacterium]
MIFNAFKLAIGSIGSNALRSILTILGIIIGVAAVITMVTLGAGATQQITGEIEGLGSNLVLVVPGTGARGASTPARSFEIADADAIRASIRNIDAVAPTAQTRAMAVNGNENWSTNVTGIMDEYFEVFDWRIAEGRALSSGEIRSGTASCIIGSTVKTELFGSQNPINQDMRLSGVSCRIVGVLGSKGQSTFGTDQDDVIMMPMRTFHRRLLGSDDVSLIAVSASEGASLARVKRDITYLMRDRRRISAGEDADFSVRDMTEIVDMLTSTTNMMTMLLSAVAGVSLLVGGIGIMNIMLVSVTERTREIGIRLAIGARKQDVLTQFLVEAVVLASLGGLIGVILALIASWWLAILIAIPFTPDVSIIALSFVFSSLVGVCFGYVPALRAANLNPIEALRYE